MPPDEPSVLGDHHPAEVGDEFVVPFDFEKTSEGGRDRQPRDLGQFHREVRFNIVV